MDETSQKIIDAAMELMIERGYSAATTKDIARRAGVNECTIFRKFQEKREIVLRAMEQERWHPDLKPEDFNETECILEKDLMRFSNLYMQKITPEFVKISIGLRTPELMKDTADGIMRIPMVFKEGTSIYFRDMYEKGMIKVNNFEVLSMMFLSLNFGFVFFKASFGSKLSPLTEEQYMKSMIAAFVDGIKI